MSRYIQSAQGRPHSLTDFRVGSKSYSVPTLDERLVQVDTECNPIAGRPANNHHGKAVDAESVTPTKVATVMFVRNAETDVATALLPCKVFGLPVVCAMLLPNAPLFFLLLWRRR